MDELQKIDLIRERLGVSFLEAREALREADGNVVDALVALETKERQWEEKLSHQGKRLYHQVKELISKGNVTKIKIKKGEEVLTEIPATLGGLALLGMLASAELAIIAGLGTVAAMFNNYSLEVEKAGGEVEKRDLQ
ncbi:MAG: DUF4342 domain-containing protein [Clostridia bacterium]|jgi:hypothetical protein|nr:DUF4342 domain-containing protein [Clostridia bacterium]